MVPTVINSGFATSIAELLWPWVCFGQLIYIDMDNDLVVTRLASWPEFVSLERKLDDLAAIDAITNQLKGE